MNKKVHLIMPMAGNGIRFFKGGYIMPKPLIEIYGKPFFYWATESIANFVDLESITFVVLQQHIKKFSIDKIILQYYPNGIIVSLEQVLDGAVLTCMAGVEHIHDMKPIIFNDCDHLFTAKVFNDYCKKGNFEQLDAALLTFESSSPKYSYLQYDELGNVIRTLEKEVISNSAICGAYYFKNKEIFNQAATEYLKQCTYTEFYVSGVYNILAKQGKLIKSFPVDMHLPFGTPEEYEVAKDLEFYKKLQDTNTTQ